MADFKDRLNEALLIRDMSAAELARAAGINEGAVSQYRKGKYEASQRNLDKIARILNVSVAWLMGADVPMERVTQVKSSAEEMSGYEAKLFDIMGQLNDLGKNVLMERAESMLDNPKYSRNVTEFPTPSKKKPFKYAGSGKGLIIKRPDKDEDGK